MMRSIAVVLALVLVSACSGSSTDTGDATESERPAGSGPLRPSVASEATLCGSSVAAQRWSDGDRGPLEVKNLKTGRSRRVSLDLPAGGSSEQWAFWLSCAERSDGRAMFVVDATAPEDERRRLFGVTLDGRVSWEKKVANMPPVVRHGLVLATPSGSSKATVLDVSTGKALDNPPPSRGTLLSADRVGDFAGGALSRPVLADADGHPIWRGEQGVLPTRSDWLAASGVAVLRAPLGIVGVDARSGRRLWKLERTTDTPYPDVDADAGVLPVVGDIEPSQSAPRRGPKRVGLTLSGVEVRTGEVLWTRTLESDTAIIERAGGGVFTLGEDNPVAYESRTGRRIDIAEGATVVDTAGSGVLVAGDDRYRLIDPTATGH